MKSSLIILFAVFVFPVIAEENNTQDAGVILPVSPPQKVFSRYQTNFAYHHDRGFYFSAALGPEWNHSIEKPSAKALRFGGKMQAGWFVAHGVSLFASAWGNFLEAASLIAAGPGVAFLFDSSNIGIDMSFGLGRVFNVIERDDIKNFSETVLAANLSLSKFWWLSNSTSLGFSLMSGIHGFTITEGRLGSIGWNVGLGLAFLFG